MFPRVQLIIFQPIGSDNGLVPSGPQAITWINDGYITSAYMRHSTSMSFNGRDSTSETIGIYRLYPRLTYIVPLPKEWVLKLLPNLYILISLFPTGYVGMPFEKGGGCGGNESNSWWSLLTFFSVTWWRHPMEIFSTLLALCEGNLPMDSLTKQVPRIFDVFFDQSGRSPKVVALFSATNFSSNIIELLQLHDIIQIKWNYA